MILVTLGTEKEGFQAAFDMCVVIVFDCSALRRLKANNCSDVITKSLNAKQQQLVVYCFRCRSNNVIPRLVLGHQDNLQIKCLSTEQFSIIDRSCYL